MEKNEIKKELYRTKVQAFFSHYTSGNLYYSVEVAEGIYQFPIPTVEKEKFTFPGTSSEFDIMSLSSDLGTTSFYREMKGSELNRWIEKAIDNNEFIKIG